MDYTQLIELPEKKGIDQQYKEAITVYTERLIASGQSLYTIKNKVFVACQVAEWLKGEGYSSFKDEKQFNSYITYLKQKGLKDSTINHTKLLIKDFVSWYLRDSLPTYLGNIRLKKTRRDLIEAELLTPSDIKGIVSKADNNRDKAMIMTLYESATRISELLNIKIKDVEFRTRETIIKICVSKTKKRKIPLFDATPYLRDWINNHPFKENPEAYVFISLASNCYGNKLYQNTVGLRLKTYAKRAGVNKHIYCHLLRHSRLSWWAQVEKLNERDLRILAGWSETSDMPNTYLHYGIDGVLKKMRINRGLLDTKELEQEHDKQALTPITCPRCERINPSDSVFCNCGTPLNTTAYLKLEQIKKQEEELHKELMNKGTEGIDLTGITDLREVMYQLLKKNPELIGRLQKISQEAQLIEVASQ